jgi:hypothetical protein
MDWYGKKRVEFPTLSASVFWLALLAYACQGGDLRIRNNVIKVANM